MAKRKSLFDEEEDEPPKGRGIYKPKNQLDGFLRFAIKGKYKWRRYAIFYDYLQEGRGHSREEAEVIVAKYQENGVEQVYSVLLHELQNWMRSRRQLRAKKAVAKRWNK